MYKVGEYALDNTSRDLRLQHSLVDAHFMSHVDETSFERATPRAITTFVGWESRWEEGASAKVHGACAIGGHGG